jgi:hypothetical protein
MRIDQSPGILQSGFYGTAIWNGIKHQHLAAIIVLVQYPLRDAVVQGENT